MSGTNNRQSREEAEFKLFLQSKRTYEKRIDDIRWRYEEFFPLIDDYKAGRLNIDTKQNLFELEASKSDVPSES